MHSVARFDKASFKGDALITDEGYIRANSVVTRCGIFTYQNTDGSIRKELRHPDDVWHQDSINSMFMIPVTNEHPAERLVNAQNYKRLAIGFTGESVKKDGDLVLSNFVINDSQGVEEVTKKGKKQLSLGYTVDLVEEPGTWNGERYDARQTNIRYNHLALVSKARAGDQATIALDRCDAWEIDSNSGDKMAKRKVKIDAEEVWMEDESANHVERLQDDMKNLTDEKARVTRELADKEAELKRVNAEISEIRKSLDKTEAERDSLRDVSDKKASDVVMSYDSAEFKRAVSKRIELLEVAKKKLNSDSISKLDSMNEMEIKKQVIAHSRKSISLDGKSDLYVEALFDTIVDDMKSKVNVDSVNYSNVNLDSKDMAQDARQRMMDKLKQKSESKGTK